MNRDLQFPSVHVGPLNDAEGVKAELARLYRCAWVGALSPTDAGRMAGILGLLMRAIETEDLERRLAALENRGAKP